MKVTVTISQKDLKDIINSNADEIANILNWEIGAKFTFLPKVGQLKFIKSRASKIIKRSEFSGVNRAVYYKTVDKTIGKVLNILTR